MITTLRRTLIGFLGIPLMVAAGCSANITADVGASEEHPDAAAAASTDSGVPVMSPDVPGFTKDPTATGARLWIEAKLVSDRDVEAEIWAAELGPVFGYTAHFSFDATLFELAPGQAPPDAPVVLGADDPAKAIELWTQAAGDVGLGAVRTSTLTGEIPVTAATRLGVVKLRASKSGHSSLGLLRVAVRRADGRFVPVSVAGGKLVILVGGAS